MIIEDPMPFYMRQRAIDCHTGSALSGMEERDRMGWPIPCDNNE